MTASNNGPGNHPTAAVGDTFPAVLTCSTTCAGAGGGSCTAGPFAGNINDTASIPSGGSVTLTLDVIGPYLELVVSDTGIGIAARDLKRLGRPFEQAGAVEQKVQGTGLGLSLVRALSELHGGRMSLESTLGEGTAVTVRMPVAVAARATPPEGGAEVIPFNAGG